MGLTRTVGSSHYDQTERSDGQRFAYADADGSGLVSQDGACSVLCSALDCIP